MPKYRVTGKIDMSVEADTPDEAQQKAMEDVYEAYSACGFKLKIEQEED
jgi:hypothetical protein